MRISYASLGCKVNLYESEAIIHQFLKQGFELVDFKDESDVVIINTCTVTATSDSKSRKIIRQAVKRKKDGIVAVMGCFSQLNPEQVETIEGVDIILGTKNRTMLLSMVMEVLESKGRKVLIEGYHSDKIYEEMKIDRYTTKTRGFIKIQDGCNNYCSYCRIPYARGPLRSRKHEDVIDELNRLSNQGMKEVVLTGINTGTYGQDFPAYSFADLLRDILNKVPNLGRVRISSIEATEITDDLLTVIRENLPHFCNHFHIPLQGGATATLARMNRKYTTEFYAEKIAKLREISPNVNITTDVMVGFAGETEEDFQTAYQFIENMSFGEMHVFPYSKRPGTNAFNRTDHIDEITKRIRVNELIELNKKMAMEYRKLFQDQVVEVIVEKNNNHMAFGHSSNYLQVQFASSTAVANDLAKVRLTKIGYPISIGEEI